ncbi:MAG: 23S rRNA (uridine2552-2'-O)-methyltransferase [Myxococcota bacterium]|jgi:23S rRNA (uridine2552-2'-O)-methyltransferase
MQESLVSRRRRGSANPYARPDRYTVLAKKEGYAARSVYKLDEIQNRFRVLAQGDSVLDLGCSPGSWSRFAQGVIGGRGTLVGVDIEPPADPVGEVIVASIFDLTADQLRASLGGDADAVLSDMAPRTTGNALGDHARQIELASRAMAIAREVLRPGGNAVVKVFDGEDAHAFVQEQRPHFTKVKRARPDAVRRSSREFFLVCLGAVRQ